MTRVSSPTMRGAFPSSQRRGGAKREPDRAKPQKKARRGGEFGETFRRTSIKASPYRARASRHPVCKGGEFLA